MVTGKIMGATTSDDVTSHAVRKVLQALKERPVLTFVLHPPLELEEKMMARGCIFLCEINFHKM